MAARSTSKPDTDTTDDDAPTAAPAGNAGGESSTPEPASAGSPDPTRIVIEQAPPEPAVFYGEDALVPGAGNATDPNRPHVKADYHPFEW